MQILMAEYAGFCEGVERAYRIALEQVKQKKEIFMNIKTDEKNIEIVQKEFWTIIKEIEKGKHKKRFNVLKKVTIDQIISAELLSEDIVEGAINEKSKYGKITSLSEELINVKATTYKGIINFTKEVFNPEWTFTEIILPSKK